MVGCNIYPCKNFYNHNSKIRSQALNDLITQTSDKNLLPSHNRQSFAAAKTGRNI